jgi:hypothetical protein
VLVAQRDCLAAGAWSGGRLSAPIAPRAAGMFSTSVSWRNPRPQMESVTRSLALWCWRRTA